VQAAAQAIATSHTGQPKGPPRLLEVAGADRGTALRASANFIPSVAGPPTTGPSTTGTVEGVVPPAAGMVVGVVVGGGSAGTGTDGEKLIGAAPYQPEPSLAASTTTQPCPPDAWSGLTGQLLSAVVPTGPETMAALPLTEPSGPETNNQSAMAVHLLLMMGPSESHSSNRRASPGGKPEPAKLTCAPGSNWLDGDTEKVARWL
jgi:hypothetical protein